MTPCNRWHPEQDATNYCNEWHTPNTMRKITPDEVQSIFRRRRGDVK